jgi:hypothetical protein
LEYTATTVVSADPSALNNTVVCIDAGDLDSGFLKRNRCYKAATGLTMASAKGFDFYMFCHKYDGFLADCEINTGQKHQV